MKQNHSTPITPVQPAGQLLQALTQLGYSEGPPAHLAADCKAIDAQLCRSLVCPGCKKHGMQYRPLHRGRQYAAVAVCGRCGAEEEI